MKELSFKKNVKGTMEEVISKLEPALKNIGFGILNRIDFDKKMKEKLNKDIEPTVILGACHPAMAYEAFKKSTDVTALIPCNVTLRQIQPGVISVETAKPSVLLSLLGIEDLILMAESADLTLLKMLDQLS